MKFDYWSVHSSSEERQSKELQCNLKTKMKNPQQKKNDAFFYVIHSKLPVLSNIKMSSVLSVETDMQRMTGLGHMQLMQEKLPSAQKVCCPDSIDMSHLSSSVKDGKQEEEEHKSLPASKNSQGFIFNAYQKENHELIKTVDDLRHPGSINIQEQPQRHFTQTILESTSCPIFDQCQFGNSERYARFYPPKLGEAKIDAIFSATKCVVPSDANHQEEQTGNIKKKKTATFDYCISVFSTSKRRRNIQQCSDMKMLVNPKCRTLKAKKPSMSYILNIKGGASPNHRKELGCNLTTEMKEVEQSKKMADEMYSFMTITPDISGHNKVEREQDRSGERLSSNQVKQVISLHEGNVTSDDTKETSFQGEEGEESEQETLLKVLPQHGKFFLFCSDWEKELDLHKSEDKGSEKTLFVTGQDIPRQMQPTDPLQVQEPKKSCQAQNGTIYTAHSELPLLKSKESLVGQSLIDTVNCGIPNIGNLTGELYSRDEEKMPGVNENQQAAVLESLGISTPDPSESKRQRKTFQYTTLKSKMSSKCVIMKARKTRISQIFNIPGYGYFKNLPFKMLEPMIIGFLVHMEYFEVLENISVERKEGLTQELPAMVLEFLDLSTLALPTSKRKYLKRIGKRNKMSSKCLTLKAKSALISQTFNITKCGVPRHRRQFKRNFKLMVEESIPVAAITLSAISSAMPVSLDINVNDGNKVETDVPWKMSLSHELQQREQSLDGERTSWASSSDRRDSASNNMNKIKVQGREAALNTPHFSFNTQKMKETHAVNSDLELKNSARKTIPDSVTIARELQQHALYTQHVLYSISHSILNLLPFEMLPKTTKTQPGLKDTKSLKVSSPMPGQSVSAQHGIPFEKSPRKQLDSSIADGKIGLEKDLPAFLNFSMSASPDFKGQKNVAQIPKSRTRKAQMVLKSIKITRSDAPSHGKQWDGILGNMAKEISLGMSNMFINTSLSSTPVSPAIKTHQKVTAKEGPLRKKSNIRRGWKQGERKLNKGKRLCTCSCNKPSASNTTLESRWQSEGNGILFKAALPFLNRVGSRKDQNMLITEQEMQPQMLVPENISASVCSPLMIPFQIEKLKKSIPSQNNILHRAGEKISCPKSGKAICDDFLIDETEYSTISDGSPARKLDVHSAVSLQPKEKEDTDRRKVTTYTIDQNIPPPKSGNSVLGDPCDGISRRKLSDHTANNYEELQRDSLTMSMASVLFESERKEKVLEFPVRKILAGPISVTKKTKKPVCSQMHTVAEHSSLYCRRKWEYNLKSTIKDMQQSKSIVNTFPSPTPFPSESKRHIEMYSIVKAETDQQLEKSLHYREAQKFDSTDTQKRSSYTVKMNVQQNKQEVRVGMINFPLPKHQEKETQGSKETQALTSLPFLPHLKLDKETQRILNTGEIVHTKSIGGDIMKDVQNKKQPMPQKEDRDRGKTVTMRGMAHTADTDLKSNTSPPSYTLHRTELYVNIGRQEQKKHEDQGKPPDTVLKKVSISRPPTNLKLDKGTQVDEEELRIKGPPLFPQVVSALSDSEKIADTETTGDDVRKRKQHLSQEEKDREQNGTKVDKDLLEITGVFPPQLQLPESSGAVSIQYAESSEGISAWNVVTKANQHRPHKDGKGRVEIEDGKGGILPKTITSREETCPLKHILSRNRPPLIKERVTDVQTDKGKPKMVLRKTCVSLPSPSHLKQVASINEMEDTLRTTQSCFPPLNIQDSPNGGKKAYTQSFEGHMLKEEDRPQEYFEDKMLPMYMDLEAKKLLLPHILNAKELHCKIKEQKRKVQENKNQLITNVKNICTSFLTLPYHTFDATEEEGCGAMVTEAPLPPAQSKASSDAVEIAHAETTDGELSQGVKALKEEKDREKNTNTNRMVGPHVMYLNAEKSSILLVYNLSGPQRKTKKRERKVQKVACVPSGVMPTKTCTPSSSPLHLDMNIGIEDKSTPTSTRSSVSPVNSQESSDSEEVVYGEPMTRDMLISPQEGKQHMPRNKKEVGVQTRSPTFPEHQGKKMQASKDKREAETQRSKEYDFGTWKKTALRSEDDSGMFIRSLSVSVMSPSQTEETVEFETSLEREKRLCLSKSPPKSPNASDIVKRNNSSTVKKGSQGFTNLVPEDSQPFLMDQKQMQNFPSVRSEENLSGEVNKKCLTPQTEEGVVLGHISRIIKEHDLLIIEQEEKAPKPILTPTEHPGMSADPKENTETHIKSTLSMNTSPLAPEEPQHETQPVDTVACASPPEHRDRSEPTQDTTTPKVQGQKPFSGTVPRPPQIKSNEIKLVADSMCAETLPILCEAIKNVFESQIKTVTQDKVYADILEKVKAHSPHDWKSPPFSRSPDVTFTTIHPKLRPKPMLESKALEIKLNLIPTMAKQSFQKLNFYPKRTITEDNTRRPHPRHKHMKFLSLEEIDTIQVNLKHKYQRDSPHISCMKTMTVDVSRGSKEIIAKLNSISKLESGTSSVTPASKTPLSQILQNYSVEEKDKFLIHFAMKTLEIQMKAFPGLVRESRTMATAQHRRKPLCKCLHLGVQAPKHQSNQSKRILLLFEEKSLHQIELDLQCKYLHFLLGFPVQTMFPKPNRLPKYFLMSNTVATCKKAGNSGESGSLSAAPELLEQHVSFKKQSPCENSSLIRRFMEPTPMCASDPEWPGTAQRDTTVFPVLTSHVTLEKDKHHVWFQETETRRSFDLKTRENAPHLVDYHSIQISQDFTGSQTDMESSANLEECSAFEMHDSEESIFLEANPYLNQESENILSELQKGIPLENFCQVEQIKTDSKPGYSDNSGSLPIRGCREPSSAVSPPSQESHHSRKYGSPSRMQCPDWQRHSSQDVLEVALMSSSIPLSEEKLPRITKNRTGYSLAPLTESNIKLHLAKSQDKPHRQPESKDRKKAKFYLFRRNSHKEDGDHSCTQRQEKHRRKQRVWGGESERMDDFPSKYKSAAKPHQEGISLHSERKQNPPFFYACVPADSLEIIPQTIRWTIPPKTLRKRSFRVPLLAELSSTFNM